MVLIQMLKAAGSATFGELLQKYEAIVTRTLGQNSCTRVDLIFDQCRPLSIKVGERKKQGEASSLEVNIHSGSTPILKQWTKLISNPRNKERLAEFVCENLIKQQPGHLGPFHKVLLAGGFTDGSRTVSLAQGNTAAVPQLRSHNEEGDTRILLHAKHAASTHPWIVTQSPDTDVAVLAVAHFKDLGCQELWLQTGAKDKEIHTTAHHSFFPWSLSLQVFTIFPCSDRVRLNECFCSNRKDKALEGVNNERSVTDKPQQPWRESCITRISTEHG